MAGKECCGGWFSRIGKKLFDNSSEGGIRWAEFVLPECIIVFHSPRTSVVRLYYRFSVVREYYHFSLKKCRALGILPGTFLSSKTNELRRNSGGVPGMPGRMTRFSQHDLNIFSSVSLDRKKDSSATD